MKKQEVIPVEQWKAMKKKIGKKKHSTKGVDDIAIMLNEATLRFTKEYKFCDSRKFKFDFVINAYRGLKIEQKIAIEFEGLMSEKSGHTTIKGYTRNCEKYNLATVLGWKVLRYTIFNYHQVIRDVKSIIELGV